MRITTKQFSDDPGRWVDYARTNGPVSIVGEGGEVRSQICIPGPVSEFEDCRHEEELTALRAENARLRAAVRAADAMARALLDKSSGAHECNGGPERCWYCADAESDRAVVSAFDQARARGDV